MGKKQAVLPDWITVVFESVDCAFAFDALKDSGGGTMARDCKAGTATAVNNKIRVK